MERDKSPAREIEEIINSNRSRKEQEITVARIVRQEKFGENFTVEIKQENSVQKQGI